MGVAVVNFHWISKLLHHEVPPNAPGIIVQCFYYALYATDSTGVIIAHLTTPYIIFNYIGWQSSLEYL